MLGAAPARRAYPSFDRTVADGTRHLKLDFKEIAAVEPCLKMLAERWPKLHANGQGVWLNADVLPGPNARRKCPVPFDQFVPLCRRMCPQASLSLGWRLGILGPQQAYSEADAMEMARACQDYKLDGEQLVVGIDEQGIASTRSALDLLAAAQIASGQNEQAVISLLAGRTPGVVAARRLGLAAELLDAIEPERGASLIEAALDQAAAVQAWNHAEDLLRLQLRLELASGGSGDRPRERLKRLATRVDDRFTLMELEQDLQGVSVEQQQLLEQELRSPRDPGGHAALGESPAPEAGGPGVDVQP